MPIYSQGTSKTYIQSLIANSMSSNGGTITDAEREAISNNTEQIANNINEINTLDVIKANVDSFNPTYFNTSNSSNISLYKANSTQIGSVLIGDNINVVSGTISILPATNCSLGVMQSGDYMYLNDDGVLNINLSSNAHPGLVQIGDYLEVNNGIISSPLATNDSVGVVKIGDNIDVTDAGIISVPTATTNTAGIIIPDGSTIGFSNGKLTSLVNTAQTVAVANSSERLALEQRNNMIIAIQSDENLCYYLNANDDPSVANNWIEGQTIDKSFLEAGDLLAYVAPYEANRGYTQYEVFSYDLMPYVATANIDADTTFGDANASVRYLVPEGNTTIPGMTTEKVVGDFLSYIAPYDSTRGYVEYECFSQNDMPYVVTSDIAEDTTFDDANASYRYLVPEATGNTLGITYESDTSDSGFHIGDFKWSFYTADHDGWVLLNGRAVSTLTSNQQDVCSDFGWTSTIPNIAGKFPMGANTTYEVGDTGGNNTIYANNLPNSSISFTSNAYYQPNVTINLYSTNNYSCGGSVWQPIVANTTAAKGVGSDEADAQGGSGGGIVRLTSDVSDGQINFENTLHRHRTQGSCTTTNTKISTSGSLKLNSSTQRPFLPPLIAMNGFVFLDE